MMEAQGKLCPWAGGSGGCLVPSAQRMMQLHVS